jgi:hypothetical protein
MFYPWITPHLNSTSAYEKPILLAFLLFYLFSSYRPVWMVVTRNDLAPRKPFPLSHRAG